MADRTTTMYRLGAAVARSLPEPVAIAASRVAGWGVAETGGARRLLAERNLRRAYGRDLSPLAMRRAVQRSFESYARYYAESFRLPRLSVAELDAGMSYEGYEHMEDAFARGVGPIMVIPHLGGWEWAAFWFTRVQGLPLTAVVEPLEPPELFEWFVSFRRSLGMNVVPLGPLAGSEVVRAIKAKHVVTLLCDRDIGGSGVPVTFFGEETTLPAGPATLALRTGAPLLPCAIYYRDRGHHGVVRPPLPAERSGAGLRADVARITQEIADALEDLIRAAPDQWHLLQPNWPSDHEALQQAGYA
jgi:KDO2-lipid IV(A) lauroyltransferase